LAVSIKHLEADNASERDLEMEKDANSPLETLENLGMLWAYVFKSEGENGLLELFGDRLYGAEHIQAWAVKLRAMRLVELADLLDSIARTMPPSRVLVNPDLPHGFDREQEMAWAAYVESHQDDERVLEHDQRWKRARADWLRRTGCQPLCVI
jgi:hypothetical protein